MAYSFSADAVQYSRDNAYYARDLTSGGGTVLPGPAEVRGDLVVDGNVTANLNTGGTSAVQLTTVNNNPTVLFKDGGAQAGLYYDGVANTLSLGIGSNPVVGTLNAFSAAGAISTPSSVTAGTALVVGSSTAVGGAISGYSGTSLVAPNFPQGVRMPSQNPYQLIATPSGAGPFSVTWDGQGEIRIDITGSSFTTPVLNIIMPADLYTNFAYYVGKTIGNFAFNNTQAFTVNAVLNGVTIQILGASFAATIATIYLSRGSNSSADLTVPSIGIVGFPLAYGGGPGILIPAP
jgi:hypothetical protein